MNKQFLLFLALFSSNCFFFACRAVVKEGQISVDMTDKTNLQKDSIPILSYQATNRDKEPLPKDAIAKFQLISRFPDPTSNYKWLLFEDGSFFIVYHSGNPEADINIPFDQDFPAKPDRILSEEKMQEIRNVFKKANFFKEPVYQLDENVEDGSYFIITYRNQERLHEVIYEAVRTPLVEFLWDTQFQ